MKIAPFDQHRYCRSAVALNHFVLIGVRFRLCCAQLRLCCAQLRLCCAQLLQAPGYGYLLNMPLGSFTVDKTDRLERELAGLQTDYAVCVIVWDFSF